ncbi:MAG: radical SAM protein [Ruminococcus sp.]|nr:radical SAM protein [Ruminococcus sp.]
MKIGLYDADGHKFPNLPLMKISAWHKSQGDSVEFAVPLAEYDRVYVSRVFGDEYSKFEDFCFNTKEIVYGGTGFAITIENGREVYTKTKDTNLPYKIEHIYPDYSLYPTLTKNTAYGFLTRGCPNDCGFCIVSKKEGRISKKVADLSEFWRGQSHIKLLDANLLACKDKIDLLNQLAKSGAKVDFTQGLDARFITDEVADLLAGIKIDKAHFAFDFMKNERAIIKGLQIFQQKCTVRSREAIIYMLTNYDTTIKDDLYRVNAIRDLGFQPDVRIYRKSTAPRVLRDLQRWCNNRFIFHSCDFMDYVPRKDGKTIRELYFS